MFGISSVTKHLRLNRGKKVVLIGGTFDLLHHGHVRLLNKAKKLGDVLVVGISSDAHCKKLKGDHRPIVPERKRAELLSGLKSVSCVFITNGNLYEIATLKRIKPDVFVFSDREKDKVKDRKIRARMIKEVLNDSEIIFINSGVKDISTSAIEKKIWNSRLASKAKF